METGNKVNPIRVTTVPVTTGGKYFNNGFKKRLIIISIKDPKIVAGVILMGLGLFPKLGALVAIMPNPVLGGAGIVMFGVVAASGIKTLSRVKIDNRNLLIIAVSIGLGLGVTVKPEFVASLPSALQMLFSSGISAGTIVALTLNIILKEEK